MSLKPSRLRRINQRLTLAKYKIKTSASRTLKGLVIVFITKRVVKKYIMLAINNQKSRYFLFYRASASASEYKLLNQLVIYDGILSRIQLFLILFLFISISNAIAQSYSNNKY